MKLLGPYSLMVFLKQGEFDTCLKLLHRIEERGCEPSVQTYSLLIKEFHKEDKHLEAKALANKIMEKGFVLDEAFS